MCLDMQRAVSFCFLFERYNDGSFTFRPFLAAQTSGTTVTFLIIEGWFVTVASVGDSRCIVESADGTIYYLSADHRLECNEEEYV